MAKLLAIVWDMKHGREQLKDWVHRRCFNQREAAAYLEMHDTFLCQILGGTRAPNLRNALRIESRTGIPVEAWVSADIDKSLPTASPVG